LIAETYQPQDSEKLQHQANDLRASLSKEKRTIYIDSTKAIFSQAASSGVQSN
jgi:hypothetical protein